MHKLRKGLRRFWRIIRIPLLVIVVILVAPLIFIGLTCGPFRAVSAAPVVREPAVAAAWADHNAHLRPEDRTYLTFP